MKQVLNTCLVSCIVQVILKPHHFQTVKHLGNGEAVIFFLVQKLYSPRNCEHYVFPGTGPIGKGCYRTDLTTPLLLCSLSLHLPGSASVSPSTSGAPPPFSYLCYASAFPPTPSGGLLCTAKSPCALFSLTHGPGSDCKVPSKMQIRWCFFWFSAFRLPPLLLR